MSRKPRVLIVSGSYPDIRCGVAGHVRIIADGTARRGEYDVEVLTSRDPRVRTDTSEPYPVHPLIERWSLRRVGKIGRQILALRPDVVHLQNPTVRYRGVRSLAISALGVWLKCRAPRVRLVVMQHDIAISDPLARWRYYPLLRAADAVVVSNRRDYQAVRDLGIAAGRIYQAPVASHFTCPNPRPDSKAAARRRMDIPPDALCVVCFGFVHPERNVDILLRVLAALRRGGPTGPAGSAGDLPCQMRQRVHGLILGGPSPGAEDYYHACRQLAHRLGLSAYLRWTGYATEGQVLDGLAAGDVFVNLPQRGADMRNTSILSAVSAGLAVVTSENPRFYRDRQLEELGCVLVPPRSVTRIAAAVGRLLSRPPEAVELANRARRCDPQRIWSEHLAVNHRAYRGEPPGRPETPAPERTSF